MSSSVLIGYFALNIVPPAPVIQNGIAQDPSPVEFAKFHARMQSLRRALRNLESRGLIIKTLDLEDRRKWCWQVTAAAE